MKTSSKKSKGRRLQYWVAQKISDVTGLPWGKDMPIESCPMSQSGADIRLDDKAKRLFPFYVECKNQERWEIMGWIKMLREKSDRWLLFCSKNRFKPVVTMDAELFFSLYEKILKKWDVNKKEGGVVDVVEDSKRVGKKS